MKRTLLSLCFAMTAAMSGCGEKSVRWGADFPAAQAAARSEKLPLLLLFTGSDWCRKCIVLEEKVLGSAEFNRDMPGRAVFFIADFPKNRTQSQELKEQNLVLKERYGIVRYPTLLLLGPGGEPLARHEGEFSSPEEFKAWFQTSAL